MLPWWIWVVAAAAVLVVAGLVAVCAVVVGAQSEERRGGLLELDTWEARNALRHLEGPAFVSKLRRCNRERGVHFHGAGDWCECGDVPNVRAGGDAA